MIPRPEIRRQASHAIDRAGVRGIYPVPLERVAAAYGFETLSFDGDQKVSGAIKHSTKTIFVNSNDPSTRQRFTLAHEIGHAVLHRGMDEVDYRRTIDAPTTDKEREANHFAAELLMPVDDFRNVWSSRDGNAQRVAAFFGVSVEAAQIHAKYLSLL